MFLVVIKLLNIKKSTIFSSSDTRLRMCVKSLFRVLKHPILEYDTVVKGSSYILGSSNVSNKGSFSLQTCKYGIYNNIFFMSLVIMSWSQKYLSIDIPDRTYIFKAFFPLKSV